jgi:streptogramin lyase
MRLSWRLALVLALLATTLLCSAASAGAAPTMTEFALPTGGRAPAGITAGPDGNVWFAESAGPGGIGRITPLGAITEFTAGLSGPAEGIALGPDGNLWFTEPAQEKIGRITPTGTITEFSLPAGPLGGPKPAEIVAGRDGNLWFTIFSGQGGIGRITPTGTITEFTSGLTPNSKPQGIAAGPDGNLWFTETANPARIGRITPEGTITEFSAGLTANSKPQSVAAGPSGNLWFTEEANPGRIGRITTAGTITQYETGLPTNIRPEGITAANDGNLYFTEFNNPGEIGKITTAGVITQTPTPTGNSQPLGIATGPNGNLWFTEAAGGGKIGTLTVAPSVGGPAASNIAEDTATLTASVGANSQTTEYFFQYGLTSEYGSQTSPLSAGSGATPAIVSSNAVGLSPSTAYHFRAVATNASGTTYGQDQTFMTASAPAADTLAATAVTLTAGTLHAAINPQGQATTYHFDWGTTTAYASRAPIADANVGSDGSEHAVEQTLAGLAPDTSYHFRVVASNCGGCTEGTTYGPDRTFTTAPAPLAVTGPAQSVQQSSATLTGIVNPQGASTTYHFDWGTSASYGNQAPAIDGAVGSDSAEHSLAQALTGLMAGTTYHYRVVASDCEGCASGTTYGGDVTFTTGAVTESRDPLTPPVASSPNLRALIAPTVAPPSLGTSAVAGTISGVVLVRVPGAAGLVPLDSAQNIPIGSVIDAQHGIVRLTTAVDAAGKLQSATLWHGSFAVGQRPGHGMTTFTLPRPTGCAVAGRHARSSAASAARAKKPPALWAKDDHGQYSTRGQNSVATVRGTYWETVNRCDGTLTKVEQGLVSVRDLHRHRSALVHAGQSYLAKR